MPDSNQQENTKAAKLYRHNLAVLSHFLYLKFNGRNAAVDIDCKNGELILMATKEISRELGLGSIPECRNKNHLRIVSTDI